VASSGNHNQAKQLAKMEAEELCGEKQAKIFCLLLLFKNLVNILDKCCLTCHTPDLTIVLQRLGER
jgi:hypothetical protein